MASLNVQRPAEVKQAANTGDETRHTGAERPYSDRHTIVPSL